MTLAILLRSVLRALLRRIRGKRRPRPPLRATEISLIANLTAMR